MSCIICETQDGTARRFDNIKTCLSGICGVMTSPGIGLTLAPGGPPLSGGRVIETPVPPQWISVKTAHIGAHCMECHHGEKRLSDYTGEEG